MTINIRSSVPCLVVFLALAFAQHASAGDKPPMDVPHPVKTFTDTLSLGNSEAADLPAAYILTVDSGKTVESDGFYRFSQRAEDRGWQVFVLTADHNPQWSALQPFVDLVARLAK